MQEPLDKGYTTFNFHYAPLLINYGCDFIAEKENGKTLTAIK